MKLPGFMYKKAGRHQCKGGTYDYLLVEDHKEVESAVESGWWPTLEMALSPEKANIEEFLAGLKKETSEERPLEPDEPPKPTVSRKDMEALAKKLGVIFNKKTTDEQLESLILEAEEDEEDELD